MVFKHVIYLDNLLNKYQPTDSLISLAVQNKVRYSLVDYLYSYFSVAMEEDRRMIAESFSSLSAATLYIYIGIAYTEFFHFGVVL